MNYGKTKHIIPSNITAAVAVLNELLQENENPKLLWHCECRPNFMSKNKLNRFHDYSDTTDIGINELDNALPTYSNTESVFLRSQAQNYIKGVQCVLCCSGIENGELFCARSFNIHGFDKAIGTKFRYEVEI